MSAPIAEAHRILLTCDGVGAAKKLEVLNQLIADSEAKAVKEVEEGRLRQLANACQYHKTEQARAELERDQLRAEADNKTESIQIAADRIDELTRRANHWCDMHTVASAEADRNTITRQTAELTAERARLDAVVNNCWIIHKGNENAFAVRFLGEYITPWVATPRAAIDAAMKEGAK